MCIRDRDVTVGDPTTGVFTNEAVISVVSVDNFVVGDGSDASHDGHWHHEVTDADGNVVASGMNYDGNPVVVVNLTTGDYSARMFLVDNTHQELDPVVEEIITFSVANAPECGETISYCYDSDGGSLYTNENPMVLFSQTAAAGETISVTFAGGVEEDYDFVIVMNGAGVQIGDPLTGDLAGVTVTSDDGTITVGINPDTSWSCVSGQSGFASLDMTVNCEAVSHDVTFSVNTQNITVGAGGIYLGGGVISDLFGNGPLAVALTDDGTGTWSATISLPEGTSGNYKFFNSPADGGDWNSGENLSGQDCADPDNWDDRILAPITGPDTLLHCYNSCETDGSCPTIDPIDVLSLIHI